MILCNVGEIIIFRYRRYISGLEHIRILILSSYFLLACINTIYKYGHAFFPKKKSIYISLLYCGIKSQKLTRQLKTIYSKISPSANLICLFKPVRKLNSLSKLKSPYKLQFQSDVVFKIRCLDCLEFYIVLTPSNYT